MEQFIQWKVTQVMPVSKERMQQEAAVSMDTVFRILENPLSEWKMKKMAARESSHRVHYEKLEVIFRYL